jgi:hypothetical protein
MANQPDIKYFDKDFSTLKQDLINYAQTYFQKSYMDFSPSAPGNMFIEMAAYVGDVLSFYTDTQLQETLLLYAQERKNIIALAYALGYRPKIITASSVLLDIYQVVPSDVSNGFLPDYRYALRVEKNATVKSVSRPDITFITQDTVDFGFSSSYDPTVTTIYQYYTSGPYVDQPSYYLLKKQIEAISGQIKTTSFSFGNPEQFPTVTINDTNIIQILGVTDSDDQQWYEVPYLAQDTIFDESLNLPVNEPNYYNQDDNARFLLRLKKVQRRFSARFDDDNNLKLEFGSGVTSVPDETIIPNPDNVGLGLVDGISKMNMAYDPSNFQYTNEYGIAPTNTTLTVTYLAGGGSETNLPSDDIGTNDVVNYSINSFNLNSSLVTIVESSLRFNNPTPSSGGGPGESTEQIRLQALANFPTQNRNVTKADYLVRALSMPAKFGYINKAYVAQDYLTANDTDKQNFVNNNPLALSMYILSNDLNGKMAKASSVIKQNLKTYLSYNKMMSDAILIKDAYYANIKVNFDITVLPAYNSQEVLTKCITNLKDYFDISKWQINQPIIYSDIYNLISTVKGVQSTIKVDITNLAGGNYSAYSYDIQAATKQGVIYPSLDPMIFEVRYPDTDIYGRVVTY